MPSDTPLTALQERYRAQRGSRPAQPIAQEIGITLATLRRFEADRVVSLGALHKITQWTRAQERAQTRSWGGYER